MTGRRWTKAETQALRERYPHEATADLARDMGMSVSRVYNKAHNMGLKKTAAFFASDRAGRIQRGRTHPKMIATQFRPGQKPWNKGKKGWQAGGRSKDTQFKKGRSPSLARNYLPIGSLRISADGLLERKMNDRRDIPPARRWVPVHRLTWEATHGPVPQNHIVVFRPGQHTTVESEITPDRLECISRREHMLRNSYHTRYPKEVARMIQLRGALNRKINNRSREHEEQT